MRYGYRRSVSLQHMQRMIGGVETVYAARGEIFLGVIRGLLTLENRKIRISNVLQYL